MRSTLDCHHLLGKNFFCHCGVKGAVFAKIQCSLLSPFIPLIFCNWRCYRSLIAHLPIYHGAHLIERKANTKCLMSLVPFRLGMQKDLLLIKGFTGKSLATASAREATRELFLKHYNITPGGSFWWEVSTLVNLPTNETPPPSSPTTTTTTTKPEMHEDPYIG